MKVRTIIWSIILILVIIFAFQNTQRVTLNVYFWDFYSPLIVVILISLVVGFFAGMFLRNIGRVGKGKIKE